jgi:methanethiol oxidase
VSSGVSSSGAPTADGRPWVSFTNVRKKTTTGPAGPHMILFDPGTPLANGEH